MSERMLGDMTSDVTIWNAALITASDRCAAGTTKDVTGEALAARLSKLPAEVKLRTLVPDNATKIIEAVRSASLVCDLVVITGGTGLAERDVTPQALRPILDIEIPGMGEAMRAAGLLSTPLAMLSRQFAGLLGTSLILALPGSPQAALESLASVWLALPHALQIAAGSAPDHSNSYGQIENDGQISVGRNKTP